MTPDTMFRTGNAVHGRDGLRARERSLSPRIAFKINHAGQLHTVVYGRFADGRVESVSINGFDDAAACLATLLLQRGVEIETVRRSVGDGDLIAVALDRLMALTGGPRTAAYRWLQKCQRRQTINRRRTSATWKHWAEADEGEGTTVEEFNDAAIALGFDVRPIAGTLNCWINIAEPKKSKGLQR